MPMSIVPSRRGALAAALPLAAALGACTTWSRQPIAAPRQEQFYAGLVRVTRGDGSLVFLDNVTLGRDSVVGRRYDAERTRVAIALSEVRSVEARRENALGTLAMVALGTAAALAVYAAVVISTIGTGS
jgi:hypothetical protein